MEKGRTILVLNALLPCLALLTISSGAAFASGADFLPLSNMDLTQSSPAPSVVPTGPQPPSASQFIPFTPPTTRMPQGQITSSPDKLTLTESLNKSLELSPRIAGVKALLGIAKSNFYQASAMPNPGFYMSVNYTNAYLIGASIPVEPPWKMMFRMLVAKRQYEQVKLDIMRQLWQFRSEVRRNYVQLVMADEMFKARADLAALAEKAWQTTKAQFDNGNAPGLDVRRAKLAFIQAKMNADQARIQVDQNREALNLVMGKQADEKVEVAPLTDIQNKLSGSDLLPNFNQPMPSREKLAALAHENRLELKIAKQAILTNIANLKNAYGNILPTPRFVTGFLKELNPSTGPVQHSAFLQTYVDLPLFNFQQGDISRFRATDVQLKLDLNAQDNLIQGQVSQAYNRVVSARERIRTFKDEALPEAQAVAQIAKHGFELGQTDLNTLLDSQRATMQTKSDYLDAVLSYQLALNDLEQSIGVPLD